MHITQADLEEMTVTSKDSNLYLIKGYDANETTRHEPEDYKDELETLQKIQDKIKEFLSKKN